MRHRVNPLTPIVQVAATLPAVIFSVAVFTFASGIAVTPRLFVIGALALIGLPLVIIGYGYLAWQRMWFWFDDDGDFRLDSGVVFRNQRRLQLSRLQAVDIVRPIIPRLLGFAVVVIEVAGTRDSRVRLRYLTMADAQALRAEVIARAAGMHPKSGEAPERVVARVPAGRLAAALLMRSSTMSLILLTAAIFIVTVLREGWGGLVLVIVTGSLPIALVIGEFLQYGGFTISESPDGLRMRFGLLQTQTRTVPPGRVQAVDIVEPFLWRSKGWVRVRVNIAGVGSGTDQGQRETLITPVAPREEAWALLQRVFPADETPAWQSAPHRARWRSPIQWSQLAMAWTPRLAHLRSGLITRHHVMIPHSRTQSVRWTQGPWQRALGLATTWIDSTPGPVHAVAWNQDAIEARRFAEDQANRARQARQRDHDPRWMRPH